MIALDTNVVVRLVTGDDPEQAEAAQRRLQGRELFLAKTTALEVEWVLRYSYGLSREVIHRTFRRLLGLRGLMMEDRAAVLAALEWFRDGMDFADALHLASTPSGAELATFDRRLARAAAAARGAPPVNLLQDG